MWDLYVTLWKDRANYLQDFSRGSGNKKEGAFLFCLGFDPIVSNFKL